jgi:hypothetical protein
VTPIGFSTGNLPDRDFRVGVTMLSDAKVDAIELSALREDELDELLMALDTLPLDSFKYISFHAPSKRVTLSESDLCNKLWRVAERRWPIIVHPDMIEDFASWRPFKDLLCVENMDKRKRDGRTARELEQLFTRLPDASLCFDLAHARQIDPTMGEAASILLQFPDRIQQIHISDVSSASTHERLSYATLASFSQIRELLPTDVPYIFESPVSNSEDLRRCVETLTSLLAVPSEF